MSALISVLGSIGSISALPKLPSLQPAEEQGGFGAVLSTALQHVNELSNGADQQIGNHAQGWQRGHEHGNDRGREGRRGLPADDAGSQ